ncbi:MAG: translocation/assembly module TamB, partial [Paramuribaculum sp.]|nr:translocation/assembly module TamB [Paramuribaculum sp.]
SGKVYATRVLTPTPQAYTPGLDVKGLKYNGTVLGDAELRSRWYNDNKSVSILADITQSDGRHSYVDGAIFVTADSLDLRFKADRLPIGFLKTYMAAFATDISGYATGDARLWGTFKLIDMTGEVYGEDVKITLGFTNTSYTTTDTVRFTPGRIDIQPLTIRDDYGNTATLSGWLTHKCFKSPEFKFEVTDARDLLVYDVKENPDQRWYGRVFGNGRAEVSGAPGIVDITMDMTTAGNSTFTYILSNALVAEDYTFLTFRDRDQARKDSIRAASAPPLVLDYIERGKNAEVAGASTYHIDLRVDITPQAAINLVMDPVGGDCVRAHGSGNLRMTYDAANNDLKMNGTYVVDRGSYNFTLQDIIIKNFTLREGSSIAFHGDPYAAQLDIVASYQVKANISDLDQSFLEDKELNRTNVPVDALLIVKGDMRQPDITFDLDFPTLTQETKRKVRSIINTEEMMNRQIIYLLALNRFYTPEYMNATRGNELFSVASSTLASQLSNILGQFSDNWSISPNLRSDRGDFSDVEVDVALSSQLLNNRLLLNGNFGYRDKSLNNNSFIGDFDIEYLLNPSGSWRLKAYNRYNDQNYYLKSALTTQGVGIVFKRDFDDFFSFLRHKKKPAAESVDETPSVAPTAPVEQADTSLIQFR